LTSPRPRAIIQPADPDPPIKTPDPIGARNNYLQVDCTADNRITYNVVSRSSGRLNLFLDDPKSQNDGATLQFTATHFRLVLQADRHR
jgi:hypothetical protein